MTFKVSEIKRLPEEIGVYLFLDKQNRIIYVGKAINLKKRVCSYFSKKNHDIKTSRLVEKIEKVRIITVFTEFEALLLEARLIRLNQPKYNIKAGDDKHYIYITLTNEKFPRVVLKRTNGSYGPFPSKKIASEILAIIRTVFPYCTQSPFIKRPCFYSHIELCSPCPAEIKKEKDSKYKTLRKLYFKNIRSIRRLLDGHIEKVRKTLSEEMKKCAKALNFEEAAKVRNRLNNLEYLINFHHCADLYIANPDLSAQTREIEQKELISILSKYNNQLKLLNKIECYDISNIQGKMAVGSMVTFTNGRPDKNLYRRFKIRVEGKPNDFAMLSEVMGRRLTHTEWKYPDLMVIDGGKPQLNAIRKILAFKNLNIPLIGLAKRYEEIVIVQNGGYTKLKLRRESHALHLVQRLRDEAHRFAHKYHELIFKKKMLGTT